MKINGQKVSISNEDKQFFPSGITKGDLIDFYLDISDYLLPHLKDRPVMIRRFPNGIKEQGFYQKEVSDYFPHWMPSHKVAKKHGHIDHIMVNDKASLVYLVNQGAVAFHTWLSKIDHLHKPDKLIIDLDPPGNDFEPVRKAAFYIKEFFASNDIKIYPMTTGSKGLHLVLPLKPVHEFDKVRDIGKKVGEKLVENYPDTFTLEQRKQNRDGKIYFDIQRNAYGQTGVAPYSLRPIEQAPIATPLNWEELKNSDLTASIYTIKNIKRRLGQKEGIWEGIEESRIKIIELS